MKMKYYIILILATLTACNKKAIEVEDLSRFEKIYLVQAGENNEQHILNITDSIQTILLSAGLGGVDRNGKDIQVIIDIPSESAELVAKFNEENLTDYEPMPPGSYEIEDNRVTIKKEEWVSNPLTIKVKTEGYIIGGKSYLLPVSIMQADKDIPVNPDLKTAYIQITGKYPLGKEPPIKVFDMSGRFIFSGFPYQNGYVVVETNGSFGTYEWNGTDNAYSSINVFPNGGWNIFDKVIGVNGRVLTRWAGTGVLWEYAFDVPTRKMVWEGVVRGEHFNEYDIISYSKQFDALLCRKPSGELYLIKRGPAMWNVVTTLGTDFAKYRTIGAYLNGFLCVDTDGELFFYTINDDLSLGEMKHVGSGWSKYQSLMYRDDKLLALDFGNVLWQYDFDLAGFWDIR